MVKIPEGELSWVEVSEGNLRHNVQTFRNLIGGDRVLCPTVKANAYGHGLVECSPAILKGGADWLGVNSILEAVKLRENGITVPVYIMGYIALNEMEEAVNRGFHFVVYNRESLIKLDEVCKKLDKPALTHLKVETGNNRQGVNKIDLEKYIGLYSQNPLIKLEGVATHFANIEDTTDYSYARAQLERFNDMVGILKSAGLEPRYFHCANTAATILFPETYHNMVRTGIGTYGLWPSSETMISARHMNINVELKPVLSWKTKVAQIRDVSEGEFIGYGCSYKAPRNLKTAILPVGYYDGFDRKLSNIGYVLIQGKRAPVRGRICMNMTIVDVTNIPEAALEDEVVLIGSQGDDKISAETFADWCGTINYEVVTSIRENIPRVVIP